MVEQCRPARSGFLSKILDFCGRRLATGALGVLAGQVLVVWTSLCGTAVVPVCVLVISAAAALALRRPAGNIFGRLTGTAGTSRPGQNSGRAGFLPFLLPAVVLAAMSWSLPEALDLSLRVGSHLTQQFAAESGLLQGASLAMIPGAVLITVLLTIACGWEAHATADTATDVSAAVLTASVGLCSLLLHAVVSIPMAITVTCWLTAAVAAGFRTAVVFGRSTSDVAANAGDTGISEVAAVRSSSPDLLAAAVAAGLLVVAVSGVLLQLFPGSLPLTMVACLLTALIVWLACRRVAGVLIAPLPLQVLCVIGLCALPAMHMWLIHQNLTWQSSVNSPEFRMLLRAAQCAGFLSAAVLPLLLKLSRSARADAGGGMRPERAGGRVAAGFAIGAVVALAAPAAGVTAIGVLAAGATLQVTSVLMPWLREIPLRSADGFRLPLLLRGVAALVLTVSCPLLIWSVSVETSASARLLFTERSVVAVRRGVERDLIDQSEAVRLVDHQLTVGGDVQVWRRDGAVVEYRRNGIRLGEVSQDTEVAPQPIAEILPAILPLTAHPAPRRVLLVGDDSGVCLRTCRGFPLQRIVALRSDEQLTKLVDRYTWAGRQPSPVDDESVTILHRPVAEAIRQIPESRYDAVIIVSEPASTPAGVFQYSSDFYQLAGQQLLPGGILCQRFQQQNTGADSLLRLMSSAMAAFAHVTLVQTIPGEFLLLADNADSSLMGVSLWTRLQHDYIRREIAAGGWDWSQVAMLPLLHSADPVGVFAHRPIPRPNSVASGRFALSLPFEVAGGPDRSAELQQALAPHQMRLADLVPSEEALQETRRRISALSQQREILAGMPDEPWTYRKSLRVQLQRNPRAPQEVIRSGQVVRTAHPLDQHQLDYFQTLGQCLQKVLSGEKSYEAFSSLENFTQTYEPLLSPFVYYELVRLHELAGNPSVPDEFRQRLHTVYFTEASDASVRPVIAAIRQLVDHPDVLPNDAERFDQMNSLLQKLIERWEARTVWEPRSSVRVQNDVEQSVHVTNLGLSQMEAWASAAGVSRSDFLRRQRFVNAALVGPLRDYRDRVLAHRQKTEKSPQPDAEVPNDLPLLSPGVESLSN